MKLHENVIIVLFLIAMLFCSCSYSFGEEKKEIRYEKDIEGVLGPGDPHALEIKKQEAYLTNLYLKHPNQLMHHVDIGEYQYYVSTRVGGGTGLVSMEVLYFKTEDLVFVYELRGWMKAEVYIERNSHGNVKRAPWDQELYEYHLERAYLMAVEMFPNVNHPHPFLEWALGELD